MSQSRGRLVSTLAFALALTLVASLAYAQGAAGISTTLSGSVVDTSGGVVPGADILAKNNATATEYRAVTNDQGRYVIPAIAPGTYTVTVSLMGFKSVILPDITVITGTPANVKPVILEVGKLEESVTVTGAAEVVQTQTAAVTTTLTTAQISKTPLSSRNTLDFVTMLPGVNTTGAARYSTVMGLLPGALNITIDGLNTQDNALKSSTSSAFFSNINPRLDAVEEVNVSTANPGAESSGQGAVQIRFQTRSGTNKFQGSVYDYMRRTNWNTNYWFNQYANSPSLPNDKTQVDVFGFRVGGPVVKDKLFYFFNYEEFRQPLSMSRNRTVLTPQALAGNFTYNAANGAQYNLFDIAAKAGFTSTPDPAIMRMLNDIAATYGNGSIKTNTPLTNTLAFQNSSTGKRIYPTTRIDYNLTTNNRVGGSFYLQRYISNPDILNNRDPAFPGYSMQGNQTSWRPAIMLNWRTVLGSSLVNEARGGYTGWPSTHFSDNITSDQFPGGMRLTLPLSLSAPYAGNNYELRSSPVLNFEDTLNWMKGKHTVTFGGAYTNIGYNDYYKYYAPFVGIGYDSNNDPAEAMFTTANFPNATASDLDQARGLYSLLTGRITSLNNTAYLNPGTGKYEYMGPWQYWVKQTEIGTFVSDSWKVKPNLTLNGGLRWEVQLPFLSSNRQFTQLTDYNMIYGISGLDANGKPNYFAPGSTAGTSELSFSELKPGQPPFKTDWNNIAPSVGVAWRPNVGNGFLAKLLSSDPVLRAGYSKAYVREGLTTSADIFGYNPGGQIDASRNDQLGNLIEPGGSWPLLLRESGRLGPPAFDPNPSFPLAPAYTDSINAFYPNTQTPWVHSFNISFQRSLNKDTAVDIRYVGTRSRGGWVDGGRQINERDLLENGFLDEFRHAQANYLINEQTYNKDWGGVPVAGKNANSFAYQGLPGQYPLPIFQAFYTGDKNSTKYTASQYTSTTNLGYLTPTNPNPGNLAAPMFTNSTMRGNGLKAGYPANFFYMNPGISGGVYVTGRPEDSLMANYDAAQIEVRRRMTGGLLIQGSYQYIVRQESSQNISVRVGPDWYNQGSPRHVVKLNWTYELPFGQGKRFAGGVSRNLNRLVGGWSFDGNARIQSGNVLDFGNVRLVGMTDADLQSMFYLRMVPDDTNPKITRVYMLPRDVIDNTIKAYSTTYSTPTGYNAKLGAPTGRYFAPIQSAGCLQVYTGSCGTPIHHYVTGPKFARFDMSIGKRVDITSRVYGELRVEALNVFNNVNFFGTTAVNGTSVTSYAVTSAFRDSSNTQDPGGRLLQLSWRVSW